MPKQVIVLGAGIVGVCTALHLQSRGLKVILVDRKRPGGETSFGNAGLIQREAMEPYPFPQGMRKLAKIALMRDPAIQYRLSYVFRTAFRLNMYRRNSLVRRYAPIAAAYGRLVARSTGEHWPLIEASASNDLIETRGWKRIYRSSREFDRAAEAALRGSRDYGIDTTILDGAELAAAEPALMRRLAGAVFYRNSWSVKNPGELVLRYGRLFEDRGGIVLIGDADSLREEPAGWSVVADQQRISAAAAVIALGPWSDRLARKLGYHFPLFIKRGYHRHYRCEAMPHTPLLDVKNGYLLAPMTVGLRLTTGAEVSPVHAEPTSDQLIHASAAAAQLLPLGDPCDDGPWMGSRPCVADMLPIMGAGSRHRGLWFNFGHGHQGLTLGPVTGRLLAEMLSGENSSLDIAPYSPDRFKRHGGLHERMPNTA